MCPLILTFETLIKQSDLERSGVIAHEPDRIEKASEFDDGPKYPIFSSDGGHSGFVFMAVGQKPCAPVELLLTYAQLNLRSLLNVADPLTMQVRRTNVEFVATKSEPDRYLVRLSGFAAIVREPCRTLSHQLF